MPDGLTVDDLTRALRELGLRAGDDVLVHSSLSSLGHVDGGAAAACEGLVRAVSPGGTVCVPTLTGSRKYSAENPPRFSASDPCYTGAIPEAMRARPGAVRSLHPTHSVACVGPRAQELAVGHEDCATPCGEGSPYVRLARSGGKVLFIGCDLEVNTTFHSAEELAGLDYVCQRTPAKATVLAPDGEKTVSVRLHRYGCSRCFSRAEPLLEEAGALRRGTVGEASCMLVDSGPMLELVLAKLREDPEFLLADSERRKGLAETTVDPED